MRSFHVIMKVKHICIAFAWKCIYLFSEMKTILKYLFLTIVAVMFWNCAGKSVPSVSEDDHMSMSINAASCQANVSTPDSHLCLPRQVSYSNVQRVQSSTRRSNSVHRSSFEFIKSGKEIHAGLRYLIQKKSLLVHSSLIEPANRLLYLSRLII